MKDPQSLSTQRTPTPVEVMAEKGLIQAAITSYKMSRLADDKNDGVITFGGLDDTKFDPATLVALDNINTAGFWGAAIDTISVDGSEVTFNGTRKAILDTGTTLILMPATDAQALHASIPGAKPDLVGGFIVPCNTTATISFTFGGREFTIDSRDLAFAPLNLNDPNGECISGIVAGEFGASDEWLVSMTFCFHSRRPD